MKGYVITVDALVALSFLFLASLLIYSQTFHPQAPYGVYLKQFTLDVLTVMEKSGALEEGVEENSTEMRWLVESTPDLMCMQVSIINSSNQQIALVSKTHCGEFGREFQVASRPFVHDGEMYMVKAESWYRKELK
jgi:hypothetical protein